MFDWLSDPQAWIALLTLTSLEIVLGIDNIIFISILSSRLPNEQQARARFLGLGVAMVSRLLLLLSLAWIMRLTQPLFEIWGNGISGRDLILILGGLFLLGKSTHEIHARLEVEEANERSPRAPGFASVIFQIMILDIVFSLDSVVTAVGMVNEIGVMMLAIILAVGVMMIASGGISAFVDRHPTIKMLALSFLLLIGMSLVAEGFGQHIPKGYIYFAMAFSVFVELLNIKATRRKNPVQLHPAPSAPVLETPK